MPCSGSMLQWAFLCYLIMIEKWVLCTALLESLEVKTWLFHEKWFDDWQSHSLPVYSSHWRNSQTTEGTWLTRQFWKLVGLWRSGLKSSVCLCRKCLCWNRSLIQVPTKRKKKPKTKKQKKSCLEQKYTQWHYLCTKHLRRGLFQPPPFLLLLQAGSAMQSDHVAQGFNQSGHEKPCKDEEWTTCSLFSVPMVKVSVLPELSLFHFMPIASHPYHHSAWILLVYFSQVLVESY